MKFLPPADQLCLRILLIKLCTIEVDEDDYDVFDTVFKNITAFRWPNGIIPYEFNDTASDFDELYLRKIFDAMSFLNTKLDGCIYIRWASRYNFFFYPAKSF